VKQPPWKLRRRVTFGTLVFCALIVVYVAIRWDDTSLAETLVLSMAGLAGTIVASYVGFATYEDTKLYRPQRKGEDDDS
jgi:NhaP-type Na+/H+ or K+/H+ antiporter